MAHSAVSLVVFIKASKGFIFQEVEVVISGPGGWIEIAARERYVW